MKLHGVKLREASRRFFFCLENSSTTPPMKKTVGVKGVPLLTVRLEAVALLFAYVSGALLSLCFLGNAFCQWGKSVTTQNKEKL